MTGVDLTFRIWESELVQSHFGDLFDFVKHPFVKAVGDGTVDAYSIQEGIAMPMENWFWQAFPPRDEDD